MKTKFERHSIATLAQRFKGLICRNTIESWLTSGRLFFEVGPRPQGHPQEKRGERFWLFKTEYLDGLTQELESQHDERVRRQLGNSAGARIIRETARRQALEAIKHNVNLPSGNRKPRPEKNPALNDMDAVGRTCLDDQRPRSSVFGGWSNIKP